MYIIVICYRIQYSKVFIYNKLGSIKHVDMIDIFQERKSIKKQINKPIYEGRS